MQPIILLVALSCSPTKLENVNLLLKMDKLNFERAKMMCPKLFPDSPCLVKFIKRKELSYFAICGQSK